MTAVAASGPMPTNERCSRCHCTQRTGPSTRYAKIITVPAGARVQVYRCSSWCHIRYGGRNGWAYGAYIASGRHAPPPRRVVVRPPPPRYGYYHRPYWDRRHNAWYDGRRWYFNGRWYDRPSGFSFGFGLRG